jgi:predicted transcriptional regulator
MMTKVLRELIERAKAWPEGAQEELAQLALEIEAELRDGNYVPTASELEAIDRGLRDVAEGRFASPSEVEAVFAKYRMK